MGLVKNVVRFGVIGTLAGGGLLVVAEAARPGAAGAVIGQGKETIGNVIDRNVDDPIALRAQIKSLEQQYPKKIAEVRGDLAEVRDQVDQLARKLKESRMVVQLTQADLSELDSGIAQARNVAAENPGAIVRISMSTGKVDLRNALNERREIEQTKVVHENLVHELQRDLGYLTAQETQLAELLTKLETEQGELQGQLFALDAQIDAIGRNDRMIAMMEDRQKTIDEVGRYQSKSLDQLKSQIASIRAEQQSRLDAIAGTTAERDYIREARDIIDLDRIGQDDAQPARPTTPAAAPLFPRAPEVIDVEPTKAPQGEMADASI